MAKKRAKLKVVRNKNLHHALVKILLKSPVTNLKFSKGNISLDFFGYRISDKLIVKRENHVGEWSRRRREIFIDKNFGKKEEEKSFRALCIHEIVERFLVEKFGLKLDEEAHVVATRKEKEYLESVKGNWRSHEMKVFWDWHKLGEH
jgi:hypothetical protein